MQLNKKKYSKNAQVNFRTLVIKLDWIKTLIRINEIFISEIKHVGFFAKLFNKCLIK